MRIFQILTFYPAYLQEFYTRQPHLLEAAAEEQLNAFRQDGFSGGHMFGLYQPEGGWDARVVIGNCLPLLQAFAREYGVSPQARPMDIIKAMIRRDDPDVLLLSDPIPFDSRFVRYLNKKPPLVVGWRAASIPRETDWSSFDLILSHLSPCREVALRLGAKKALPFRPGFPSFLAERVAGTETVDDVVFSGQWTSEHGDRNRMLLYVAEMADRAPRPYTPAYYLAHYGSLPPAVQACNRRARWGLEMYRALRSGRIVLNAEIDLAKGEAGNMRLFESTGVGRFVLTEHQPNLADLFVPGKELDSFASPEELMEKIRHYLDHPAERERVAAAGQARCLRDYNMPARSGELAGIFRQHL